MLVFLTAVAAALVVGLSSTAQAQGRVYPSADTTEPLAVGAHMPTVSVLTVDGEDIDLANVVAPTGALLIFYRGGW